MIHKGKSGRFGVRGSKMQECWVSHSKLEKKNRDVGDEGAGRNYKGEMGEIELSSFISWCDL